MSFPASPGSCVVVGELTRRRWQAAVYFHPVLCVNLITDRWSQYLTSVDGGIAASAASVARKPTCAAKKQSKQGIRALGEEQGQWDGRDGRWSWFLRSALFIFKCGGEKKPQLAKNGLEKACDPIGTSRQQSPLNETRTLIAFSSGGFPVCENLPLCPEPRQTVGPGFYSSGPPVRRIWYLLKIEKTIFLPVVTSLPQVIPLRQTTHSHEIWSHSSRCLHNPLFEFEGLQNCGSFPAKDAQIRTLLDLYWLLCCCSLGCFHIHTRLTLLFTENNSNSQVFCCSMCRKCKLL